MYIPIIAIDITGYIYLGLSLLYRLPQIYKLHKTKKGEDISLFMIIVQNLSYIALIMYGIFRSDTIIIISTAISIVQNIYIIALRHYYKVCSPIMPV